MNTWLKDSDALVVIMPYLKPPSSYANAHCRTNAPWGLQRISQTAKLSNQNTNALTFTYTYDSSAGSGVDIYIVGEYWCFSYNVRLRGLNVSQ